MLIPFIETSARSNKNIEEAFIKLSRSIVEVSSPAFINAPKSTIEVKPGQSVNSLNSYCC
jgi:hypothetical protein